MVSEVSICNGALDKIGGRPIVSFSDDTKNARICDRNYAECRDTVLEEGLWHFARKRAQLAELSETPEFGYTAQFQLPSDYLHIVSINGNDEDEIDYQIEGDVMLISESSVQLVYIYRLTDPTKFTAQFRRALEYNIAANIAYSVTGSRTKEESMIAMYERTLRRATGRSSQEQRDSTRTRSDWLNARL